MAVNKVMLIGNLGKDPELRKTQNGTSVANFSIAITEYYKDKDGNKQTSTEWVNIEVWGRTAEFVGKYARKGSQVFVDGKIKTKQWKKDNGDTMYQTVINAQSIDLLGSKPSGNNQQQQKNVEPASAMIPQEDDLPF